MITTVDSKGRLELGNFLTARCLKKVANVKLEQCMDDDCGCLLLTLFDKKGKQIAPELKGEKK
jgi:hypothetical protein